MDFRLKNSDCIIKEVSRLVRLTPTAVSHVPQALQYLVTTDTILNDAAEVIYKTGLMNSPNKSKWQKVFTPNFQSG